MYLVFFDESKMQPDFPHYHIGAVCIEEPHMIEVEASIKLVAETAFGSSELTAGTELHAADMYHRKRNFKHCPDFGFRLGLFKSLLEVLSRPEVRLIDIQINCDKLHANQEPDEIAFMFLCERANDLIRGARGLGLLIGDRENDDVSARFSTTLSSYRARGTDFAFGRTITNLVDSVHFTHSHLSRFLQLADVYTWIKQFQHRNRKSADGRHQAILELLAAEEINLFPSKYKTWPK